MTTPKFFTTMAAELRLHASKTRDDEMRTNLLKTAEQYEAQAQVPAAADSPIKAIE